MKAFTIILSIYFIGLAIVPCTDTPETSFEGTTPVISTEHHNHSVPSQDNCTPFCSCACCGSLVMHPTFHKIEINFIEFYYSFSFHYTFDYSLDFKEGVWHPPAIG